MKNKLVFDDRFEIKNRRYMGNKNKLLPFIKKIIQENCNVINSFCDIFAGTGAVANAFNDQHTQIIANDILKSNYVSMCTFLQNDNKHIESIRQKIEYLNSINTQKDNYFSNLYGNTFFTLKNARKIGFIRETIDRIAENSTEKQILITSLIYALDKIANTVGHYDAYRSTLDCHTPLKLRIPKLQKYVINQNNLILNKDANIAIRNIKADVLYLDPPYNSRQYCDTYHLLENITSWAKPQTYGKVKKMNRANLKSKYCLISAVTAFDDLITNSNAKHIFLSYNNTMGSRHGRSNARIDDNSIKKILRRKGKIKIFETSYREFTTGKTKSNLDHTERIFYCKVTK